MPSLTPNPLPANVIRETGSHRSSQGLRVVVLTDELPWPLNSGKRIRTLGLLRRLAAKHFITMLTHRNADESELPAATAWLASQGIKAMVLPRRVPKKSGPGFYGRLAANLVSSLPYSVKTHTSPEFQSAVRELEATGQVDLWHCEWTPYLQNLPVKNRQPVVSVAHNIESQIWHRYYESESNPLKRWYIGRQWRKFERYERQAFARAHMTVFVSHEDEDLARTSYGATRTTVVENGVDTDYFEPVFEGRDRWELLIMGSLDWRPNIDGINQFLQLVFPRLRAIEPRFHLSIVGRNPDPRWSEELSRVPGVSVFANVPDVRKWTRTAGALVVPLRIGGGSRLKILEAAASGLPIISTRIGAEGLEFEPGRHFHEVSDIAGLEQGILSFANAIDRANSQARSARTLVVDRYSWNLLAEKMEKVWIDVASLRTVPTNALPAT